MRRPASALAPRRAISDRQGGAFAANVFRRADARCARLRRRPGSRQALRRCEAKASRRALPRARSRQGVADCVSAFPSPPNQVDRRATRLRDMRLPSRASSAVKSSKMPNKMLIDATHPEETRVVVVRGNRVEEFDFETAQRKQLRGNIYLAKVTRVEPSLQAAFIEYGGNRHGFLAFSEIHPDYYQIPVADRQALIEADERAHREAEEESENRSSSRHRGRSRHRNARRRGHGDRVQSGVVENAGQDPAQAAQPYEGEAHQHEGAYAGEVHPHDAEHHENDAGHREDTAHHDHEEHGHDHDHSHDHHDHDPHHDHETQGSDRPADAAGEAPVAEPESDAPAMAAAEAVATEARHEHTHDDHAHGEHHDDEHAHENAVHADDAPHIEHAAEGYAVASADEHAPASESDDGHDEEEDDDAE